MKRGSSYSRRETINEEVSLRIHLCFRSAARILDRVFSIYIVNKHKIVARQLNSHHRPPLHYFAAVPRSFLCDFFTTFHPWKIPYASRFLTLFVFKLIIRYVILLGIHSWKLKFNLAFSRNKLSGRNLKKLLRKTSRRKYMSECFSLTLSHWFIKRVLLRHFSRGISCYLRDKENNLRQSNSHAFDWKTNVSSFIKAQVRFLYRTFDTFIISYTFIFSMHSLRREIYFFNFLRSVL